MANNEQLSAESQSRDVESRVVRKELVGSLALIVAIVLLLFGLYMYDQSSGIVGRISSEISSTLIK
ncbi:MAG: hypothetical protein WC289_03900 [Patescibacteria group bacterium]